MHYLFATGLFFSTSSSLINLEYCKKKRGNESQHFSKFVYIRSILFVIFDIPIYDSSIDIKYIIWNIKYKIFAICNKWKCGYYPEYPAAYHAQKLNDTAGQLSLISSFPCAHSFVVVVKSYVMSVLSMGSCIEWRYFVEHFPCKKASGYKILRTIFCSHFFKKVSYKIMSFYSNMLKLDS